MSPWFAWAVMVPAAVAGLLWVRVVPRRSGRVPRVLTGPVVAPLVVSGLALLAGLVAVVPRPPVPVIHDEFSYLLAADTFARGRVTNVTPDAAEHFETFHVLLRPTYMSKYPPGQGLMLAAGQRLAGSPIAGGVLGTGAASVAMWWMLRGYVPARWALVGALLFALHAQFHMHWTRTYWGGQLAFAGGALVLGSLPRIGRARFTTGVALASGAAILANTRPYEGGVLCVAAVSVLFARSVATRGAELKRRVMRIGVPAVVLFALVVAGMAYYNWRVTGDPLTLPYQVYERQRSSYPLFLGAGGHEIVPSPHAVVRDLERDLADYAWEQHTLAGWWQHKSAAWRDVGHVVLNGYSPVWVFALAGAVGGWRTRRVRLAASLLLLGAAATAVVPPLFPHYLAPFVPAQFLLATEGLRRLRVCRWPSAATGRWAVATLLVVHMAQFGRLAAKADELVPPAWAARRQEVIEELERRGGRHLVLVRYVPEHPSGEEWVYNLADLDDSRVIWARDMGEEGNRGLIERYRGRRMWVVEPEVGRGVVREYEGRAERDRRAP